jgi:hypothetical protein
MLLEGCIVLSSSSLTVIWMRVWRGLRGSFVFLVLSMPYFVGVPATFPGSSFGSIESLAEAMFEVEAEVS